MYFSNGKGTSKRQVQTMHILRIAQKSGISCLFPLGSVYADQRNLLIHVGKKRLSKINKDEAKCEIYGTMFDIVP